MLLRLASALLFLMAAPLCAPQTAAPYTLRVDSRLVVVDLMAFHSRTLFPVLHLQKGDIELIADGHAVDIATFDHGTGAGVRPILLWLVAQCPEDNGLDGGSHFFTGKAERLSQGLGHLAADDHVAVAHWCDDGTAGVDEPPTRDVAASLGRLDEVLTPARSPKPQTTRRGEVALQRMLEKINAASRKTEPSPLPVLLFIHGDQTGMPTNELDAAIREIADTAGIGYVLNNGKGGPVNLTEFTSYETPYVLEHIAIATGGGIIRVIDRENGYSDAVASILERLHTRYQLGFTPRKVDRGYHTVSVRLSREGKKQYPDVELKSRTGYRTEIP